MHSGIGRCIVQIHFAIVPCDQAIGKYHIGYITHPFTSKRCQEISGRLCDHLSRIIQIGCKCIQDIPESGCRVPNTMRNMNPSLFCLNRYSTGAILCLCNRMVNTLAGNHFLVDHCVFNVITQSESDTTAGTGVDEIIHRPGIEGIFAIHKFRMQYYVSLLWRSEGFQIIQTLPGL